MFVSDKFVFIELHKTGCTHVRKLLRELVGGEFIGKHNQITPELLTSRRLFLGSIRDPWEWYVSLWSYGCDKKGFVFNNVTQRKSFRGRGWRKDPVTAFRNYLSTLQRQRENWQRSYRDVNDAEAFRKWLEMINDRRRLRDVGEGYGSSKISKIAGLLTYRYMNLFCCYRNGPSIIDKISTYGDLVQYEEERCFIEYFIRNECLEASIFKILTDRGMAISSTTQAKVLNWPRTNVSSRNREIHYYYDDYTEKLVARRDRFIIEKFGYQAPSLRSDTKT